jgi:hypothetical protein
MISSLEGSLFSSSTYLELGIALVLHEGSVPWHRVLVVGQLCIKFGMSRPINRPALELAVFVAFISIKEPSKFTMSVQFVQTSFLPKRD